MKRMNVFVIFILVSSALVISTKDEERKIYVCYMGSLPEGQYSPSLHHVDIISKTVNPRFASRALVRSYTRSFNGFAAYLTKDEKERLARYDGVVSVFPCEKLKLQTTRSYDFMGLSRQAKRVPAIESDIIIGVIDSGIWPESESFKDEGFGPIPAKWKGACKGGEDFTCNRKIIGARTYSVENSFTSARDNHGHGTHVASIAAGNEVNGVSYNGLGQGTARGGVPLARLAIYKVCDHNCSITDLLSAFDDAIADGVDIISLSIINSYPKDIIYDPIAVGSFHAMIKGILTVHAAGNDGPVLGSITSFAPWILTVAASDIDRKFVDKLLIGKVELLMGNGINAKASSDGYLPLVYGKEISSSCSETDTRNCIAHCIESRLVTQKVVLCDQNDKQTLTAVKLAGAVGCIIPNIQTNVSLVMPYPIVGLSTEALDYVKNYKSSNSNTEVQILKSEATENPAAPLVASFSARGPATLLHDLIKPDITAPGVEILAAFSPLGSASGYLPDRRSVTYSILSGTSMACPHVTSVAAYIKSFHPEWSPSAIKSALMTTARAFNDGLNSEAEFAFGSGHIDPLAALDPGLVYETSAESYLQIWCNISRTARSLTPTYTTCPSNMTLREINYPSIAVRLTDTKDSFKVYFPRSVTNVGQPKSTYVAFVQGTNKHLRIKVEPNTLQFSRRYEKVNFLVTVSGGRVKPKTITRASLVWTDGVHKVRSPIVVYAGKTTSSGQRVFTVSLFHITFIVVITMLTYFN